MASAISQSSVGTIVEDLVSDRSIPLKVCMSILNCAQLISCWIAVGYFIKTYESWTLLELALSIALLITGNYFIPCVANAVIYGRRWKRSSVSNRKQISEENKQAWVCLRIAVSLLGVPTVGRYIETIIVSRKLNILEKNLVNDSVASQKEESQLNPIGTSRIGTSTNQAKPGKPPRNNSMISGMSHASSLNVIPESNQRRVRKARRQYKRCEHDGALMALIAGSTGAGPMAIGLLFLYFNREEARAMQQNQVIVIFCSTALNIMWLAATLTHFYPARHVISEAEFERGVGSTHFGALLLLYTSHLVQVTLRVLCFVVFTNWFTYYVCIPIIFHWIVGTFLLVGYRSYMKTKTVGRPIGERIRNATGSFFSALFFGYVGIFDFVNGNEGKTRLRYLIYYTFYYIENIIMLVVWITRNPTTQIRYPIPFICSILGLFWLGFILFQLYLYYFSYSPYGSSIIGLCSKKPNRKGNYAVEVREPVFGVPVSQSAVPFWKQEEQVAESHISGVNGNKNPQFKKSLRPIELSQGNPPSIMSSQSQSITSQPSSQVNFLRDKSKQNPNLKPPPVMEQKTKNTKQNKAVDDTTTDSSSSGEEFPVFSAKPIHTTLSHPDLLGQGSNSNLAAPPSTKGSKTSSRPINTNNNNKDTSSFVASESNSRSLDNLANKVPAAQPNKHTKRIGGPTPINAKATSRPISSKDQNKSSQNRRDPR